MEAYFGDDDIMMRHEEEEEEEEEEQLPGFRFYPTDEELVDFYLRRKVENKPFTLDLIKDVDIYKFDPWDLPKTSTVGDNEWYFFCKRGRKYRNSVRPNRVTGSGFWKATGIDKPIRSQNTIVGLKKSLVYYTGNAGKGTKTDWMMHEFRLPSPLDFITHNTSPPTSSTTAMLSNETQEAEVWTVCRIFKRNVPSRKYTSNWREISTKRNQQQSSSMAAVDITANKNSSTQAAGCSSATNKYSTIKGENYISFGNYNNDQQQQMEFIQNPNYSYSSMATTTTPGAFIGHEQCGSSSNYNNNTIMPRTSQMTTMAAAAPTTSASSKYPNKDIITTYQSNEHFGTDDQSWDHELRQFWSAFHE